MQRSTDIGVQRLLRSASRVCQMRISCALYVMRNRRISNNGIALQSDLAAHSAEAIQPARYVASRLFYVLNLTQSNSFIDSIKHTFATRLLTTPCSISVAATLYKSFIKISSWALRPRPRMAALASSMFPLLSST